MPDHLFAVCRRGCGAFRGAHDRCPICGSRDVRHHDIGWLMEEFSFPDLSPELERERETR